MSDLLDKSSLNEYDLLKAANRNSHDANKDYNTINSENTNRPSTSINQNSSDLDVKIIDPKDKNTKKQKSSPQRGQAALSNTNFQASVELTNRRIETNNRQDSDDENGEEVEDELVLKYGAQHVIKLFIPVTLCLIFVIISLSLIKSYQQSGGAQLIYTPFNEDSQKSSGTKLWMSIANASIFIGVVVVMTIILILLYKFKFYKVIHGWLAFSSLMLLFFFTFMFISELFKQFNVVTDLFTVSILLWNFGIVGMFAIHWKGPLILQQIFLIFSCVQMALIFIKYLPEWTTWVLLAFISIWDLIAVLCPFGPLRILVETAKNRNDTLFPAMVYSSTLMYMMANQEEPSSSSSQENATSNLNAANEDDEGGFNDLNREPAKNRVGRSETVRHRNSQRSPNQSRSHVNSRVNIEELEQQKQDEEENGVKLGLGDFIFYSILVGKASILGDWNTVIACFVAILIGLCLTLVLLAIFHKPLPALPISLLFGLIFYFLTNLVVRPFYDSLTYKQIFI